MSININGVIAVNDSVLDAAVQALSLSGLFLTKNALLPNNATQRVLIFENTQAVKDYFGENSTEATLANNYFLGFDNSSKKPDFMLYARYIDADIAPYLRGGKVTATLNQFKAITAGSLGVVVDGTSTSITAINLSTATSYSQVASLILTRIQAILTDLDDATFTYNGVSNTFTFDTGQVGVEHTIDYCVDGALAALLMMQESNGGVLSQGADAQTPTENMDAIVLITRNWAGFTTVFDVWSEEGYATALELAKWANDQGTNYNFTLWTQETNLTVPGNTSNIAYEIITVNDYANTFIMYGLAAHAAFVLGIGGCIDYNQTNGRINWAFKKQSGLTTTVTTDAVADALLDKGVNYYGDYASKSNGYRWLYKGFITGKYKFMDNFYNQIWLADGLQNAVANLFSNTLKVSFALDGISVLKSTLDGVMRTALNNAVVEIGAVFDEQQKSELQDEAGYDISGFISSFGYYIKMSPSSPAQQAARVMQDPIIWYWNGQSIDKITINTNFIL
jgi:hypothetical protein